VIRPLPAGAGLSASAAVGTACKKC